MKVYDGVKSLFCFQVVQRNTAHHDKFFQIPWLRGAELELVAAFKLCYSFVVVSFFYKNAKYFMVLALQM